MTALSCVALLFATSTTAYVGLVLYLTLLYCELLVRMMAGPVLPQVRLFIFVTPVLLATVLIVIALNDTSWAYFQSLLDTFVFNKLNTASGEERSAWNSQALQSFMDTYGFGVGNGSARASSFLIATLAGLGVLGTITFLEFSLLGFFD